MFSGRGYVYADPGCCCDVELGGTYRAGRPAALIPPLTRPLYCCFYELYESTVFHDKIGTAISPFLLMAKYIQDHGLDQDHSLPLIIVLTVPFQMPP